MASLLHFKDFSSRLDLNCPLDFLSKDFIWHKLHFLFSFNFPRIPHLLQVWMSMWAFKWISFLKLLLQTSHTNSFLWLDSCSTNSHFDIKTFSQILQSYKTFTPAGFLLLFVLGFLNPKWMFGSKIQTSSSGFWAYPFLQLQLSLLSSQF